MGGPIDVVDLSGSTPEGMVEAISEDMEVVFLADESPVRHRADYDESHLELSGWDEEEVPQTPEDIISDRELEELWGDALGDDCGFGDGAGPSATAPTVPAGR